jgi:hypothetical protein
MLWLAIVALGGLAWSMYSAAALLACNHVKGHCNFQLTSNRRLYWGVMDETTGVMNKATWLEANESCIHFGSQLVSISNASTNEAIAAQLTNSINGQCDAAWFGASDIEQEGVWLWTGGNSGLQIMYNVSTGVEDAPWSPQQDVRNNKSQHFLHWEPNGLNAAGVLAEERDCALVGQVGNWSARNCAERHCFFCEWSEGQKDMAESFSFALGGKSIEDSVWQLMIMCSACLVYLLWIAEILVSHWKIGVRIRLAKNRKELEGISGTTVCIHYSLSVSY